MHVGADGATLFGAGLRRAETPSSTTPARPGSSLGTPMTRKVSDAKVGAGVALEAAWLRNEDGQPAPLLGDPRVKVARRIAVEGASSLISVRWKAGQGVERCWPASRPPRRRQRHQT